MSDLPPVTPSFSKRPPGLNSPAALKILKLTSRLNVAVYRATGGRIGGTWRVGSAFPRGLPLCLLTTKGRKTGLPRTLPLLHLPDGDRVILAASQAGMSKNPLWYNNLRADPEITIQVRRNIRRMRARTADPAERAELWPRLVAMYADYDKYQTWAGREIPVIICEPVP
jgi:deazaflavin-dependent oxidoreductase (nitroreductase family)